MAHPRVAARLRSRGLGLTGGADRADVQMRSHVEAARPPVDGVRLPGMRWGPPNASPMRPTTAKLTDESSEPCSWPDCVAAPRSDMKRFRDRMRANRWHTTPDQYD